MIDQLELFLSFNELLSWLDSTRYSSLIRSCNILHIWKYKKDIQWEPENSETPFKKKYRTRFLYIAIELFLKMCQLKIFINFYIIVISFIDKRNKRRQSFLCFLVTPSEIFVSIRIVGWKLLKMLSPSSVYSRSVTFECFKLFYISYSENQKIQKYNSTFSF